MTQPSVPDDVARMCRLAEEYLADAQLLSTASNRQSHADYLLQITAFEILLKALRITHGLPPKRNHSYSDLFDDLPEPVKLQVRTLASERLGPSVDYSRLSDFLKAYTYNFGALRYSYEPYEGQTDEQVHKSGTQWLEAGAKVEEADFAFYPEELFGLTEALLSLLGRSA